MRVSEKFILQIIMIYHKNLFIYTYHDYVRMSIIYMVSFILWPLFVEILRSLRFDPCHISDQDDQEDDFDPEDEFNPEKDASQHWLKRLFHRECCLGAVHLHGSKR